MRSGNPQHGGGVVSSGATSVLHSVLAPLFAVAGDYPDAEELVVNRPGEVMVERAGGVWETVINTHVTQQSLNAMALAVAQSTSQSFSEKKPILFGTLASGERLTFVGNPASPSGTVLTMRLVKNTVRRMNSYDGTDFFEHFRWVQQERFVGDPQLVEETQRPLVDLVVERKLREFLIEAVKSKLTIGVIGDTGSGKTFLMECLIQCVPSDERLITIESVRELQLPDHKNKVHLFYSQFDTGASSLDANGLTTVTKRMKPNRVFLGESIGPEAYVFINTVLAGHAGSITSWHAKNISTAHMRFALMAREHPDAKLHTPAELLDLVKRVFDVVVYIAVERDKDNTAKKHRFIRDLWYTPSAEDLE